MVTTLVIALGFTGVFIWAAVEDHKFNDLESFKCKYNGTRVNNDPLQGYYYVCDNNDTVISPDPPVYEVMELCVRCDGSPPSKLTGYRTLYTDCDPPSGGCQPKYLAMFIVFLVFAMIFGFIGITTCIHLSIFGLPMANHHTAISV